MDTIEGVALSSACRDVRGKMQDAISAISTSDPSRLEDGEMLKTRFYTEIWPNIYPAYQKLVDELVRYCCRELKKKGIDCLVLGRVKTAESIQKSLDRREQHRGKPFESLQEIFDAMHDLAGSLIAIQYADDLEAVNQLISETFRATKPPNHWTRDRQPGQLWDSRFGSYESHNHHVTLEEISDQPTVTFEIQITTQSNLTYNSFAHDWCYKGANGPMTRGDEMVMDMLHGAAIIVEVGGQYMRERQEENYNLVQAIKLSRGAEEKQLDSGNLNLLLGKLRGSGYDSFTKVERVASQFRPRGEDTPGYKPMDQLLGIISQPFKRHCLIPLRRNEDFVGRESTLKELLDRVPPSAKRNQQHMVVIEGLGGVGKTQIALEVAYRVYDRFPDCSIFWVPVISMASFENAYREIGKALNVPGIEDDKGDVKKLVKAALENNGGDWLLVIDNADDAELLFGRGGGPSIRNYLPHSQQGSILFTTCNHEVTTRLDIPKSYIYTIQSLEETEAIQMLQRRLEESQVRDIESTKKLLILLAYLPLAIKQASAFMARTQMTTTRYLEHCLSSDTTQIKLLTKDFEDHSRYGDAANSIARAWLISFRQIARDCPMAARYLKYICFLAEKDIPKSLLPPGPDELDQDEALGVLTGYAFITMRDEGDSFDIHRLVRLAMRNYLQNEERAEAIENVFKHLSIKFPSPNHENRSLWMRHKPHVETTLEVRKECIQPHAKFKLLVKISLSYMLRGRYYQAEKICQETLDSISSTNHHACESCDTMVLIGMETLLKSLLYQERYGEAEQITRQGLKSITSLKSADRHSKIGMMSYLATALNGQGNHEKAEQISRQALKLSEEIMGPENEYTLDCMGNLTIILEKAGKYDEAEKTVRQTWKLREIVHGRNHPNTHIDIHYLAVILYEQGKHDEAETLARKNLERRESMLGVEHPHTLQSMTLLTEIKLCQGMYDEAERLYRKTIELQKRVLGPKHLETRCSLQRLAGLLRIRQTKFEETEHISRQLVELTKEAQGPKHPTTMVQISNLVAILTEREKYEEAEEVSRQMVKIRKEVQGPNHLETIDTMYDLAFILIKQKKYQEAEEISRQTVKIRTEVQGPNHLETIETMERLALTLFKQEKYQEAEEISRQTVKIRKKVQGPEHPDMIRIMKNLRSTLYIQGKHEEEQRLGQQIASLTTPDVNDLSTPRDQGSGQQTAEQAYADYSPGTRIPR
ncbi:hypothetical protein F5B19DRAFT_492417 [Rostrohypoxylon terebratum]|nr:hypothetical protein F5B19DRAFT_492417 [Rostrohypoxylon terebratum]